MVKDDFFKGLVVEREYEDGLGLILAEVLCATYYRSMEVCGINGRVWVMVECCGFEVKLRVSEERFGLKACVI